MALKSAIRQAQRPIKTNENIPTETTVTANVTLGLDLFVAPPAWRAPALLTLRLRSGPRRTA